MNHDSKYMLGHLDAPYHIGYVLMDESDTRRHKSRCSYYDRELKVCKYAGSPYYERQCGSSSHCRCYTEDQVPSPSNLPVFAPPPPDSIIAASSPAALSSLKDATRQKKSTDAISFNKKKVSGHKEPADNLNIRPSISSNSQFTSTNIHKDEVPRMNAINIEPIKQTLKTEFPKETDAIKTNLMNIEKQLDSMTSSIGDLVKAGVAGCDIKGSRELLNTYEPFINKIKFYKDEITKCIDSLSK